MVIPPAKRKKSFDTTSTRLSKPFRSPLKARSSLSRNSANIQQIPNGLIESVTARASHGVLYSHSRPSHRGVGKLKRGKESELDIERYQRQLRLDIKAVEQATTVLCSSQHERLPVAISKWRRIAQEAAADVFKIQSEQVKNNGGLGNMRVDATKSSSPPEQEHDIAECHMTEDQRVELADATEEAKHEAERYGLTTQPPIEATLREQKNFTMSFMLRQFSIDPDLLCWDSETDCWLDD